MPACRPMGELAASHAGLIRAQVPCPSACAQCQGKVHTALVLMCTCSVPMAMRSALRRIPFFPRFLM
jgi:hypothetical protein